MRKLLLTIATDNIREVAAPFLENHAAYAKANGYEYVCAKEIEWPHLHASFSKVALLDKALRDNCDYAVWMDADAAFTNFTQDITDIIETKLTARPNLFLAGKQQVSWQTWKYICNGIIVLRNTPEARSFMDSWIDRCLHGCPLIIPGKRTMILDHPWEQWHFDGLIRETQYNGIYACLAKEIGAFAHELWTDGETWQSGMLTVHMAGPSAWERRAQLWNEKYAKLVVTK